MAEWLEIEENVFNFDIGTLRIKVHRHMDESKDRWVCTCYGLEKNYVKLNHKELDKAKLEALYWVNGKLAEFSILHNALSSEIKNQEVNKEAKIGMS